MTERPILFSGEMVRAILAGRKTQTRRVIKPQPWVDNMGNACWKDRNFGQSANHVPHIKALASPIPCSDTKRVLCPYGAPGDLLWVRETWAHYQAVNHVWRSEGRAFDEVSDGLAGYRADGHDSIEDFRAHVRLMSGCDLEHVIIKGDRWRPSIHMPRWASRITLRITDVRVERLQDVSEDDAVAEGVDTERYVPVSDSAGMHASGEAEPTDPIEEYRDLWNRINGPDAWEANPWVWALSFEMVQP